MMETATSPANHPDVVLVGAGIMSTTLSVILKELQPDLKIVIFERLESAAQESSNAWNNAGTGHGRDNMALTEYLISQILESSEQRFAALHEYFPKAEENYWKVEVAGQRVQIIKKDPTHGGILQFGTELVTAADGSLTAIEKVRAETAAVLNINNNTKKESVTA
jgi:L-2-hydroxyglutarate oxidase LhgO